MKTYKIVFIITLNLILLGSCNYNDLEINNPNSLLPETYFKSEVQLKAAVDAVYSSLQSQGLYGRYIPYMYDNMGQENVARAALSGNLRDFLNYTFNSDNISIYLYWKNAYNGIRRANLILDNASNIENVTDQQKQKYLGEVKFLRSFYYFLLVTRFGDIPLYTTTEVSPDGLPRKAKEQVYSIIISDLNAAAPVLKSKAEEEAGRVTSGAAYALLGKVHLYRKEFGLAKTAFDKIIAADYGLTTDYSDNFKAETEINKESVFEVKFEDQSWSYGGWGGEDPNLTESSFRAQEYGFKGWYNVNPSNSLLDEFETGDPRYSASFYSLDDKYGANNSLTVTATNLNGARAMWKKYQMVYRQNAETYFSNINHRVIRWADVLLMKAEVENELNNPTKAIEFLNEVRQRVGMPKYGTSAMNMSFPVGTKDQIFNAIKHERRVELNGEQSRFPDLMRWGIIKSIIPEFQVGKHEFLPIPQKEISTNGSISVENQNIGY